MLVRFGRIIRFLAVAEGLAVLGNSDMAVAHVDGFGEAEVLRLLVDNSTELLSRHAPDGTYRFASSAARRLLGYEPHDLVGRSLFEFVHPDDHDLVRQSYDTILLDPDTATVCYRLRHRDGHWVWFETHHATVSHPDSGQVIEVQASSRDITRRVDVQTELEALNEELITSNTELEWFASMASHDLRSPLVTVRGILDLLLTSESALVSGEAADWLRRAQSQCGRLLDNVEALLRLARIGRSELVMEDVDLNELLAEVMTDLASELVASGADIVSTPLPVIRGDRTQMRVLLQNLLTNSTKYRDPQRPLTISVHGEVHPTHWHLTVEDNGAGFDRADREAIFELFARGHSGQKLEGSGIGLATCRRILERHGGTIEADPLPDHGARFTVVLPR